MSFKAQRLGVTIRFNGERNDLTTSDGTVFDLASMTSTARGVVRDVIGVRFAQHGAWLKQDALDAAAR